MGMKFPEFSELSLIGSVACFIAGVSLWISISFLAIALIGALSRKALEMQQQQKWIDAVTSMTENISQRNPGAGDFNMDDAMAKMQNVLKLFDPNNGPKTPN
jgi:hypothetical protein